MAKTKNTQNPKIDIIICCYNNRKIIRECLTSIKNQTYKNFRCILVDDASTDDTVSFVKEKFPRVEIIRIEKNQGPSINRNIGINKSNSKYIVTLDSDIILEKSWLEKQFKFIESDNRIGISGSMLVYHSNHKKINSAGGGISKLGIGYDLGSGENILKYKTKKYVAYVCSAAMIMKREMISKIGAFDKTYFYGHEDTDLGWRANLAGYEVVCNSDAVAFHRVGETMKSQSPKVCFYATKNRIRSLLKNYQFKTLVLYFPLFMMASAGDIVLRRNRIQKLKAWWWNLLNLKDTLIERKKIQKLRKIKDKKFFKKFQSRLI